MDLPFLTRDFTPIPGTLRAAPEDFRVEEIPAYAPSGEGEHVFVFFEKRNLTTTEALKRMARALGITPRDTSAAGQKDRHAVTTQWASFWGTTPEAIRGLELPDIRVLEVARHTHKLRTGHLRANRFVLRVRGAGTSIDGIKHVLDVIARRGVPNYFGEQRFGRGERNTAAARAWIVGGSRPPRDPRERRFLASVLQSQVFNRVLAARVREDSFDAYIPGDLLRKEDTGGLFTTTDDADAAARVASWAVSPTGPIVGVKMRWPEREALAREEQALADEGVPREALATFRREGEGTRRVLRVRPLDVAATQEGDDAVLRFTLPTGAYATVVLREILKRDESDAPTDDETSAD